MCPLVSLCSLCPYVFPVSLVSDVSPCVNCVPWVNSCHLHFDVLHCIFNGFLCSVLLPIQKKDQCTGFKNHLVLTCWENPRQSVNFFVSCPTQNGRYPQTIWGYWVQIQRSGSCSDPCSRLIFCDGCWPLPTIMKTYFCAVGDCDERSFLHNPNLPTA